MKVYTRELLALRHNARLMRAITPLSDNLVRNAMSVIAYACYLCPHIMPAISVVCRPPSVNLIWCWRRCMLTIVISEADPFEEKDDVRAVFIEHDTGEFWCVGGFANLGSGTMPPVFPVEVERKLLEAHSCAMSETEPGVDHVSAFRFKRLFPDVEELVTDPPPADTPRSNWSRLGEAAAPIVQTLGATLARYLVQEAIPKLVRNTRHIRNRRRVHD